MLATSKSARPIFRNPFVARSQHSCLLEQDCPAVMTTQPIVNGGFEKAPGVFNTPTGNLALHGLPFDCLFGKPQIIGYFF